MTHVPHKLPGWFGVAFAAALSLVGGWYVWSQRTPGPRTGEIIELAPESQAAVTAQNLGQRWRAAMRNARATPATRPAASKPAR